MGDDYGGKPDEGAADNAKLIQVFVRRGLVPDGGVAYLLPRIVGMHKAKELMFFGDDLSAADAATLGIVNKIVPAAELQGAAKEWAERLAAGVGCSGWRGGGSLAIMVRTL